MEELPSFTVFYDDNARVVGPPYRCEVNPVHAFVLVLNSNCTWSKLTLSLFNELCVGSEPVEDFYVLNWKILGVSRSNVAIPDNESFCCLYRFGLQCRYLNRLA